MHEKRTGEVTLKGKPLTLLGPALRPGDQAPGFTLYKDLAAPLHSSELGGKIRFFNVVPSLDTGICDAQTRRFSQEAARNSGIEWITVSTDTPMAQARWCGASGVENLLMLSDYKDHQFGLAYGLYIEELGLLQRAIVIVGPDDKISYFQRVSEVAQAPDFEHALDALKEKIH